LVILDLASLDMAQARPLVDQCRKLKLPVLAVVPQKLINEYDPSLNPDEFILSPINQGELLARVKQAIYRVNGPSGQQVLKVGELVIDLERYDVVMAGRRITLTYKEFQLLVLLASNPGRVYTREVLLSQVWGYDYLGGTRTVDVHIRRLRSKIEDPDHSFVETIWNVGYRFRTFS
jgi:DNA-binding response OmpR family regulator